MVAPIFNRDHVVSECVQRTHSFINRVDQSVPRNLCRKGALTQSLLEIAAQRLSQPLICTSSPRHARRLRGWYTLRRTLPARDPQPGCPHQRAHRLDRQIETVTLPQLLAGQRRPQNPGSTRGSPPSPAVPCRQRAGGCPDGHACPTPVRPRGRLITPHQPLDLAHAQSAVQLPGPA